MTVVLELEPNDDVIKQLQPELQVECVDHQPLQRTHPCSVQAILTHSMSDYS